MKLSSSTAALFLLGNILLNKLWESFIWVALVVLAFNNAFAQNGRWYNLESEPKKSKISFTYSSKSIPANEQKLIKFVPKGLDNIRISSISLSIELNVFNLLSKGVLDTIEFNKRKIPKGSYSVSIR